MLDDSDWYWLGKEKVISAVAESARVSKKTALEIYTILEDFGLIDYDIEKDVFYDLIEGDDQ